MPALLGAGFGQSIALLVGELGFEADEGTSVDHEVALATAPIDSPVGTIDPGRVAAQRFTWQQTLGAEPVVTVRTNWFMGEDNLQPAWTFGPEGERSEVEITGDPSTCVTIHGWHPESIAAGVVRNPGIVATANHCVSAVQAVVAAPPGIASYLDLPSYAGRAAAHLGSAGVRK